MTSILRTEGFLVNHKCIQRLCHDECLRVVHKAKKRSRVGISALPARRLAAEHPNHVWALDYQFDQTSYGRVLKFLNVTTSSERRSLSSFVARSTRMPLSRCSRRLSANAKVHRSSSAASTVPG